MFGRPHLLKSLCQQSCRSLVYRKDVWGAKEELQGLLGHALDEGPTGKRRHKKVRRRQTETHRRVLIRLLAGGRPPTVEIAAGVVVPRAREVAQEAPHRLNPVAGEQLVEGRLGSAKDVRGLDKGHGRDELPQNLSQDRPTLDRRARVVALAAARSCRPLAPRRDGDERLVGIGPPPAVETVPQPPPEVRVLEDHEPVRGNNGLVEEGVEARSLCEFFVIVRPRVISKEHRRDDPELGPSAPDAPEEVIDVRREQPVRVDLPAQELAEVYLPETRLEHVRTPLDPKPLDY
ncbi:hypothetical protein THAOC_11307 [Thalassiosira oceanica]|uniref:Uncharacterized protein n=1 Tax=Thalassiosira oceanica TaxID=159749 RepID=K0T2W5_THAOC|nr:hypothetical protein THAOC_11307 [Thalassiosira oceanica]|eukprot:EJK67636.1 hypothetical protein THAOC_11307 [Thalassiosira oceanica]